MEKYFDKDLLKHPQKSMYNYVKDSIKSGGYISQPNPIQPKVQIINEDVNNCVQNISFQPSLSQFSFSALVEGISSNIIHKKGLIGWLSTGSGKTIVSASIIDKFWKTDKTIYYISRHDALKPHEEFYNFLHNVWNRSDISLDRLHKRFKILSIASFSNKIKAKEIDIQNTVLIIDEAQYLFSNRAVPTLKSKHEYLVKFLLSKKSSSLKVFILTATPGDNLKELVILLNIVNSNKKMITELNYYKKVYDKIIYLNLNKDTTRLPIVNGLFENVIENDLHNDQVYKFIEKVHELGNDLNGSESRKFKAYQILQKWSNSLYNNSNLSNKYISVFNTIQKYPNDKHFIYSQYFKQGLQEFIQFIESKGYTLVSEKNLNQKKKKFLIAKASEGFVASDAKNFILNKYNSSENKHGDYIQLFLATDSFNTGLDLKATKHIHFLEPTIEFLDTIQGVGRGARFCSHKDLDKKEWTVNVHHYISKLNKDIPSLIKQFHTSKYKYPERHIDKINKKIEDDMKHIDVFTSIDNVVYTRMKNEYLKYYNILNPLRKNAIDCKVMVNFHNNNVLKQSPFYLTCNEGNIKKGVHEGKPNPRIFTNKNLQNIDERLKKLRDNRNKITQIARERLETYTKKLKDAASFAKQLRDVKLRLDEQKAISKIKKVKQSYVNRYASITKFVKELKDKKIEFNMKLQRIKNIFDDKKQRYKDAIYLAKKLKDKKQILDLEKGIKIVKRQLYLQTLRHKKAIRRSKKAILMAKEFDIRQKKILQQKEFIKQQQKLNNRRKELENAHKLKMKTEKEKQINRQMQLKMLQEGKLSHLYFDTEKTPCDKIVYRHKGAKSMEFDFTRNLCKKRNDCKIISKHPYCKSKNTKIPLIV